MTKDERWAWLRKAARSGGLARQARLSSKERAELAVKASRARFKGMNKAERSEAARKMAVARWERYRKARKQKARTSKPRPR